MDDLTGLYFGEVGYSGLLKRAEEVALAQRVEVGEAARAEAARDDLSTEECELLAATVEDGLRARDHLVRSNTRLVISVAKKYVGRGVPFLDLIQRATLGCCVPWTSSTTRWGTSSRPMRRGGSARP